MPESYKIRYVGDGCIVVDGVPPLIELALTNLYYRYWRVRHMLADNHGKIPPGISSITDLIGNEIKNPYSRFNHKHAYFEEIKEIAREAFPIVMQYKQELLQKSATTIDDIFRAVTP